MPARPSLTIEEVLADLPEAPAQIAALTEGLTPSQLHTRPSLHGWSANEVLAHLRANSDVWGGNILAILAQDTPNLRRVSPRAWMRKSNYAELEFARSWGAYASQRSRLLVALEAASREAWALSAAVRGTDGVMHQRTVLYYADALARHEQQHLRQIESIVETIRSR